jgi:hypothetical protein
MSGPRQIEIACAVEIAQTPETFHAHAIPEGIEIQPGDSVLVHGAPSEVPFGHTIRLSCRATVTRAGLIERLWTRIAGLFELTELYEVGFAPKEQP